MSVLGMKRISKRVRDEAILICAIAASTPDVAMAEAHEELDLGGFLVNTHGGDVWNLAKGAREFAARLNPEGSSSLYRQSCAEAECLLRSGWSPE